MERDMLFIMKDNRYRRLTRVAALYTVICCVLFTMSCAARINGPLAADGSATLAINVSLEPKMAALIGRLSAAGGQKGGSVLDGPAIAQSMSKAPGIASVSFANTASASINGTLRISAIGDFLAVGSRGGFIAFEQASSGGRCVINISRGTSPQILNLLSSEITSYLEAIMAPLITGENLKKYEYLEEVSAVYGKAVSDEIAGSKIRASIDFPGQVTSARGGTFSGRKAEFNVPLLDLLVLETPLSYDVVWK
jgi:hypothetical protein